MPAIILSTAERRAKRADAHHLNPLVLIGNDGLTPAVQKEVDAALNAHGLIKVRVFSDERETRESIFNTLAETYIKQKDYFQAKATLQSLIENYDGKELIDQCKAKLLEIEKLEQEQKSNSQKLIEQRIKQSEK